MANPFAEYFEKPSQTQEGSSQNPFSQYFEKPATPQPVQEGRGITGVARDLGVSVGVGASNVVKSAGDIYGVVTGDYDNAASRAGTAGNEYFADLKTPELKAMEAARQAKVDAADGEWAQLGTMIWETVKSPTLWSSFLAEQAPMLIPGAGVGRATGAAAGAVVARNVTQEALERGATQEVADRAARIYGNRAAGNAGAAGGVGTGAVMQGSGSGATAYDELMQLPDELWAQNEDLLRLTSDGLSFEDAKVALSERYARNAAGQAGAVSVLTNMLPGAAMLERRLAGGRITGSTGGNIVRGFVGETVQEAAEEGSGVAISNAAIGQVDPEQELTEGVGEAAGMGALAGPFGAAAGAFIGNTSTPPATTPPATAAAQPNHPARIRNQPAPKTTTAAEIQAFAQGRRQQLEQAATLSDPEAAELEFLTLAGNDPAKLATGYNATLAGNQPPATAAMPTAAIPTAPTTAAPVTPSQPLPGMTPPVVAPIQNAPAPNVPTPSAPAAIQPAAQGAAQSIPTAVAQNNQAQTQAPSTEAIPAAPIPDAQSTGIPSMAGTTETNTALQGPENRFDQVMGKPVEQESQVTPDDQAAASAESETVLQNRDRATQASIEQMQKIASKPDYSLAGFSRLFSDGAPVVEPGVQVPEQNMGITDTATTSEGRKIPVQYAVVEASSLVPSNKADGTRIPEYEKETEGKSRAVAGNGRIAGLQRAFELGTTGQYVEAMAADERLHGVSADVIRAMKQPILVRIMPKEEITANIGDESNTRTTANLTPAEQAKTDARRVDVNGIALSDDGEVTRRSVDEFIAAMPQAERAGLLDKGQPNRQAYDRLNNLLFRQAFDSDSLLRLQSEAVDPEVRTIMSALRIAAPKLARLRDTGVYDIRGLVEEAAETAVNAKRSNESLASFIQQIDLARNPEIEPILKMMAENIRSAKKIADHLTALADLFYNESQRADADMFGEVQKRSRNELMGEMYGNESGSENAQGAGNNSRAEPDNTGNERAETERAEPAGTGQTEGNQQARQEVETPDFDLRTQSEQEARDQATQISAKQREEDAAKAASAAKAEADASRNDFRLSGSSAPADVATSYGQSDMLTTTRGSVEAAAAQAATSPANDLPEPTESQKLAGNYRKGHTSIQGLSISIENPRDSIRSGTDQDGKRWESTLTHHYGYLKRTLGADGENVDVFIGPNPDSTKIFVIDQKNIDNTFDEHKVMLGFDTEKEAVAGYKSNYQRGWKVGPVTEMTMQEFKDWLRDGDNTKPVSKEIIARNNKPATPKKQAATKPAAASEEAVFVSGVPESIRNKFPRTAGFVEWALERAEETKSEMEFDGKPYRRVHRIFRGNIGGKGASIREELKAQERLLINEETRIMEIRLDGNYLSDRGKVVVIDTQYVPISETKEFPDKTLETDQQSNKTPGPIEDLGEKIGGARKDIAVSKSPTKKTKPESAGWRGRYYVSEIVGGSNKGKFSIRKKRDGAMGAPLGGWNTVFDTKEKAEEMMPVLVVAQRHSVTAARDADGNQVYEIWRRIGDRKRVKVVDRQFPDRIAAMTYMADKAEQIIETNTTFGEADLPRPDNLQRVGTERRQGNVNGKDFMDRFGLRAVEFGNWNNQEERQQVMNEAFDGLLDLAEVLNIPAMAIGLNGDLALAFGARGQGLSSARAHYERDKAVINLTKMNGAGALAHEWFHALDHYFGRQDGKASSQWAVDSDGTRSLKTKGRDDDYVSHGFKFRDSGVREELRNAYDKLMRTMFTKAETFVKDTQKADEFVAKTKEDLAVQLDKLRLELSEQKDPRYWKRKNKPASAEQLAQFDTIAKQFLAGEMLDTESRKNEASKSKWSFRWSNDALDQISDIYKEVRGRSGFDSTNENGVMDSLRRYMRRYSERLKMLADAQQNPEGIQGVPTDFAMNAKEMDQGRGEDYWTTPHEMAARAFQGYVEDKIAEQGGRSPFLNYAPESAAIPTPWGWKRPYPRGEERKAINKEFENFVKQLQTKETDKGVALFSRAEAELDLSSPSMQPVRQASTFSEAREAAKEFQGRPITNANSGIVATVSRNNLDKMLNTKAVGKSETPALHSLAVANLDNLFERAVHGWSKQDSAGDSNIKAVHRFFAPITVGNRALMSKMTVKETVDPNHANSLYTVEAVVFEEIKNPAAQWVDAAANTDGIDLTSIRSAGQVLSIAQQIQDFNSGSRMLRGNRSKPATMPIKQATALAKAIESRYENPPEIIVVQSMQDPRIPESVRREDARQRSQGASGEPEGFYLQGKAYIVLDGLSVGDGETDAQALYRVFAHEVLGHAGLRGLFRGELKPVLQEVALKRRSDVRRKAKQYGLSTATPNDLLIAAEEVLAEMAQSEPSNNLVAKAIEAIRQSLRKMYALLPNSVKEMLGGNSFTRWINSMTDAEIIDRFIVPAREFIRGGNDAAVNAMPVFMRSGNWYKSDLQQNIGKIRQMANKQGMIGKDQAKQWIDAATKKGMFKADEVEWTGLKEWLDLAADKVSADDIQAFVDANGVQVQDVVLGDFNALDAMFEANGYKVEGDNEGLAFWGENDQPVELTDLPQSLQDAVNKMGDPAKYRDYQLPGGENYREVLLTLPAVKTKKPYGQWLQENFTGTDTEQARQLYSIQQDPEKNYKSSHWDQTNVLAHIRMNDRTDADGNRVLFIEEIQSDWAQDGRKKGFGMVAGYRVVEPSGQLFGEYQVRVDAEGALNRAAPGSVIEESDIKYRGVPAAPFVANTKAWTSLALKRIIAMAAEGGYDKIAFINGEQSHARFPTKNNGESSLPGFKSFYNEIIPATLKELAKKFGGGQIESVSLDIQGRPERNEGLDTVYEYTGPEASAEQIFEAASNADSVSVGRQLRDISKAVESGMPVNVAVLEYGSIAAAEAIGGTLAPMKEVQSTQPGITITDAMRSKVDEGLPLFNRSDVTDAPKFVFSPSTSFAKTSQKSEWAEENRRLREEDRTLWDKAKTLLRKNFAPGGLLPDSIFNEKIARDGKLGVVEITIQDLVRSLEDAIRKDYALKPGAMTDLQKRKISDALAGKVTDQVRENTKIAIMAMRQYLDNLSSSYAEILQIQISDLGNRNEGADIVSEKASLLETIISNQGQYVHRSYQVFDDPDWYKKVEPEVLDKARSYLISRYMDRNDEATYADAHARAEVVLSDILKNGTAYDSIESFIKESKLGAKDLSVLKQRKDIAPEIRELMGEYTDPRVNFAKSATKMGRLIFNQKFLDAIREKGMGVFLFTEENRPSGTEQIAADGSEVYSPLNGLYTYKEVAQAMKDALGHEQMAGWYKAIVQVNGMIKGGKTILSPTTSARNFQSAMFFSIANGHFDFSQARKSLALINKFSSLDKLEYVKKMKDLGVIYDSPYAEEMMDLLRESRADSFFQDNKLAEGIRASWDFARDIYSFGDDFWKIIGFENEKALLVKHAGMSVQQAEIEAADRIRNTYPTYSMVGKAIQWLRRFPLVGTFVSFPAEIIRTTFNMTRMVQRDWNTPGMRPIAARRALGMSLVAGFAYAAQEIAKAMFDVDDDDEEAIRIQAAPWQRNSNIVVTGRDDDGNLRYVDISFLDPYNYFKRPITAIMRDQPLQDSLVSAASDMLSPFFGTDIAAGALMEIYANKTSTGGTVFKESDSVDRQLMDIADHLRKAVQPGIASNLERTYKAMSGDRSPSGRQYNMVDEGLAWVGWRVSTLDPKSALYYRSFEFGDAKSEATQTLSRVLNDPNAVSDEKIVQAYQRSMKMRQKAYDDMIKLINASRKSGLSDREIRVVLRASSVSNTDAFNLMLGRMTPWQPTRQAETYAYRRAQALIGEEQAEIIRGRYQQARALN